MRNNITAISHRPQIAQQSITLMVDITSGQGNCCLLSTLVKSQLPAMLVIGNDVSCWNDAQGQGRAHQLSSINPRDAGVGASDEEQVETRSVDQFALRNEVRLL